MCIYTASYSRKDLKPFEIYKTIFLPIAHSTQACSLLLNCLWSEWVSVGSLLSRGGERVSVCDSGKQTVPPSCVLIVPSKLSSVSGHLFIPASLFSPFWGEHVCRPGHKEWPPSRPDQTHSILPMCIPEVLPKALFAWQECRAPAQPLELIYASFPASLWRHILLTWPKLPEPSTLPSCRILWQGSCRKDGVRRILRSQGPKIVCIVTGISDYATPPPATGSLHKLFYTHLPAPAYSLTRSQLWCYFLGKPSPHPGFHCVAY